MKKIYSNKLHILIFLLPALILFCGVLIAPIGASFYYSLFNWKGIGADKVFKVGTVSAVQDKIAYGYVRKYCEERGLTLNKAEIKAAGYRYWRL